MNLKFVHFRLSTPRLIYRKLKKNVDGTHLTSFLNYV